MSIFKELVLNLAQVLKQPRTWKCLNVKFNGLRHSYDSLGPLGTDTWPSWSTWLSSDLFHKNE